MFKKMNKLPLYAHLLQAHSKSCEVKMESKQSSEAQVVTIDVHAAKDLLNEGYRYLDVRAEEDYKKAHIKNALHIPYFHNTPEGRVKNPKFEDEVLSTFGKEARIVVGCGTGNRSVLATTDLVNADLKQVYNMGGGYKAWVTNGFPVDKIEVAKEEP